MEDVFFDNMFANVGNEPGLLQAALYHYAGAPAKSASRTRKLLGPVFNTKFEGLPGNDDAGTTPFQTQVEM
jgi:putative alpha-1,2-mannosidase